MTPTHAKHHGMTLKEMMTKYPELRTTKLYFGHNKQIKAIDKRRINK